MYKSSWQAKEEDWEKKGGEKSKESVTPFVRVSRADTKRVCSIARSLYFQELQGNHAPKKGDFRLLIWVCSNCLEVMFQSCSVTRVLRGAVMHSPSLTILKTQGSFCFPITFWAQHRSCPNSESRRGVYSRMLDSPLSEGTSRESRAVSRPVDNVHRKFTVSGSASTLQCNVAGWSRETITTSGFDLRHIGETVVCQNVLGDLRLVEHNHL